MYGNKNSITGTATGDATGLPVPFGIFGIYNRSGTITIGDGNNNSITGTAEGTDSIGIFNESGCTITTGDGNNNSITGTAEGSGSIGIRNGGNFNDDPTLPNPTAIITMGDGNDSLTGTGSIGIVNFGTIDMGDGNDKVIANGGFAGNGSVFLRAGNDYLKGFGSGTFDGGLGVDTLELTQGVYSVGISGTTVTFTDSSNIIMTTSGFEKLIAGSTTYNFTSLSSGQTISV